MTQCRPNKVSGRCLPNISNIHRRLSAISLRKRPTICLQPWQRSRDTLPGPPRSADRARSLARVSKKREYFKCRPETIGDFAPKLFKFGVWRRTANLEKAAIGGHLSDS